MRTRTSCVAAALLLLGTPAAAQTVLSEADALARLSADSPRVRAIRAAVDLARGDVLAAGRWPNPRATFNREAVAGVDREHGDGHAAAADHRPPRTRSERGVGAGCGQLRAALTTRSGGLRADFGAAYTDLVLALRHARRELARRAIGCVSWRTFSARREAAGDAAGYDRLRAEREVMDIDAEWSRRDGTRSGAGGAGGVLR